MLLKIKIINKVDEWGVFENFFYFLGEFLGFCLDIEKRILFLGLLGGEEIFYSLEILNSKDVSIWIIEMR